MPRKAERDRTVKVEASHQLSAGSFVSLEEGWVVPGRFTINATVDADSDTPVKVQVVVVTTEGARPGAESLSVEMESGSVDSSTLRAIPVRDLLAHGIQLVVLRVAASETGGWVFTPPGDDDVEELIAVTKRAIGWLS